MSLLLANQTDFIGIEVVTSEWKELDGKSVEVSGKLYRYFNDPDELTMRQRHSNRVLAIQPGWVYELLEAKVETIDGR